MNSESDLNAAVIAILDVDYSADCAIAACVILNRWDAAAPSTEHTARIDHVEPYVPGRFFERELPCLRAVLAKVEVKLDLIVVDGYVWLGPDHPGLGVKLYESLGQTTPVIGVAKTQFRSAPAIEVLRGESQKPLFVTAIGYDAEQAARLVEKMHGEHRVPTLITRVDRLARTG